jgi:hypothetical protein
MGLLCVVSLHGKVVWVGCAFMGSGVALHCVVVGKGRFSRDTPARGALWCKNVRIQVKWTAHFDMKGTIERYMYYFAKIIHQNPRYADEKPDSNVPVFPEGEGRIKARIHTSNRHDK